MLQTQQQLKQAVVTATNGKAQIKNFDAATKTLTYTVKTGKNEFTEYTAAVRRADGALVCTKEGVAVVPGYKADMVDTTGAGDSFWGGFLNCLLESGKRPSEISLTEATDFAKYGNAVASLCVEKRGAIPAMPALDKISERLNL